MAAGAPLQHPPLDLPVFLAESGVTSTSKRENLLQNFTNKKQASPRSPLQKFGAKKQF
jgi:hypothetical protein